jgi:PAS domain S-box-containing protein
MPQIVWMARPDGYLDYYNQRWYEFTGFADGEGGDESWKPILHPEDVQRCVDGWHKAVQSGEPYQIEYRFKDRQTGGYRWYLGRALPIRDETGRVVRWFGTCTDIDDQKRAEEAIAQLLAREQEARERAEAATRAKDEFVAMVSHDLRTPLTAILGWVRLLRAGQLDADDSVRALATIERSAKSQLQLTDDLLDLSRITAGKLSLNARPIELVPIIQAALDTVRLAAEAKGVQLESDLDPGSGSITGDPDRLQQVVWNLLSNAVKFTPRGGRITVRLKRAGTHAQITVSDTGIGIRADFLPYVFDRFRQADPSSPRAKGGLGLGLTIVRHLVELHGGTVRAESPGEGQGATFAVELPQRVVRAETVEEKSVPRTVGDPGPAPSLPTLDGVRVLIVDDEADAREFIAHVLDQCGARVLAVASVREALEALKLRRPDVLVSDIAMPGEDGYALMAQVKALEATYGEPIPAVALTAYGGSEDRERVLSAGYQRHIPKPVQPIKLATVIANLVGRIGQGPEAQSKS